MFDSTSQISVMKKYWCQAKGKNTNQVTGAHTGQVTGAYPGQVTYLIARFHERNRTVMVRIL